MSGGVDLSRLAGEPQAQPTLVAETHYAKFGWLFRGVGTNTQLVFVDATGHAMCFTLSPIDRASFRRDLERACAGDDNGHG